MHGVNAIPNRRKRTVLCHAEGRSISMQCYFTSNASFLSMTKSFRHPNFEMLRRLGIVSGCDSFYI